MKVLEARLVRVWRREAVIELAECGHYMLVADGVSVDGVHYTCVEAAEVGAVALGLLVGVSQ